MTFSYDSTMTTNDLNMINNNHTFRSTANREKMFNMCLPATSITLSKLYLN